MDFSKFVCQKRECREKIRNDARSSSGDRLRRYFSDHRGTSRCLICNNSLLGREWQISSKDEDPNCFNCGYSSYYSFQYPLKERAGKNAEFILDSAIIIPSTIYACHSCKDQYDEPLEFSKFKEIYIQKSLKEMDPVPLMEELQKKLQQEFEAFKEKAKAVHQKRMDEFQQGLDQEFRQANETRMERLDKMRSEVEIEEKGFQKWEDNLKKKKEEVQKEDQELNEKFQKVAEKKKKLQKMIKEHHEIHKKLEEKLTKVQAEINRLQEREILKTKELEEKRQSVTQKLETKHAEVAKIQTEIDHLEKSKQDLKNVESFIEDQITSIVSTVRQQVTTSTKKLVTDTNQIVTKELKPLIGNSGDHTKIDCPVCKRVYSKEKDDDQHFTDMMIASPCRHKYCKQCVQKTGTCAVCKQSVRERIQIY